MSGREDSRFALRCLILRSVLLGISFRSMVFSCRILAIQKARLNDEAVGGGVAGECGMRVERGGTNGNGGEGESGSAAASAAAGASAIPAGEGGGAAATAAADGAVV